ncbi:TetR/AcrR family transcriptional regulator [Nocardioides nanhaiensis]|uniref:TetR/AcrR family transcriptional regulator n=1 Tax=Nocardioides nanhaiensis TaxID=1476871 RepID=A0ABP8WZ40_9ACTN
MPRISAESLPEHRSQVRARIFEALAALMAEHSFDAITMAQIAERAGLGRTAIYHHFRDPEAVIVAFATDETAAYVQGLEEALAGCTSARERLRTYLHRNLEHGEEFHMGLGPSVYGLLSAGSRQAIREHVVAVEQVLRGILSDGVASGELVVEDLDATVSLVHVCLAPRHLPPAAIEAFVLRAVGAG